MKPCIGIVAVILTTWACLVDGHGMLMVPPSRSSMWRLIDDPNFPLVTANKDLIEKNPSDSGNNCGGVEHQFSDVIDGKCGICGDAFDLIIKPHENGRFYSGVIGIYYQQGDMIEAKVKITASHKGFFEFRLCPLTESVTAVTKECLSNHLLNLGEGSKTKFQHGPDWKGNGVHTISVKLPDDVACEHCVLQWRYHSGNNWGCENGRCATGLGKKQEEFYGCADIGINATGAPTGSDEEEGWFEGEEEEAPDYSADPENPCAWRSPGSFSTAAPTTPPYHGKPKPRPLCTPDLLGMHVFRTCVSFYECHSLDEEPVIYFCGLNKLFDETTGRCGTTSSEPYCITASYDDPIVV